MIPFPEMHGVECSAHRGRAGAREVGIAPHRAGAAGAALGIAAQVFLVVVIIGYVMPWFGADLLDMARDVAAFNLPAR